MTDANIKRTARFRELLHSPELEFLCEAHNGITARIAEEAGFKALWAGGLCMSAQFGVRDSNEASWTQVLEMLEFMADVTSVPILLDGAPHAFQTDWRGSANQRANDAMDRFLERLFGPTA